MFVVSCWFCSSGMDIERDLRWIWDGYGMEMDMGHGVQDGDRIWDVEVWMWDGFRMGYGIG